MFQLDIHDINTIRLAAAAAVAVLISFVAGCGMFGGREVDEAAFCTNYVSSIDELVTSTGLQDEQFSKALNLLAKAVEVAPDQIHDDIAEAYSFYREAREKQLTEAELSEQGMDAGAATDEWAVQNCPGYAG